VETTTATAPENSRRVSADVGADPPFHLSSSACAFYGDRRRGNWLRLINQRPRTKQKQKKQPALGAAMTPFICWLRALLYGFYWVSRAANPFATLKKIAIMSKAATLVERLHGCSLGAAVFFRGFNWVSVGSIEFTGFPGLHQVYWVVLFF